MEFFFLSLVALWSKSFTRRFPFCLYRMHKLKIKTSSKQALMYKKSRILNYKIRRVKVVL